MTNNGPHYLS